MKLCARPARSVLLNAATAAAGTTSALLALSLGGRRAEIITRLLELARRDPFEIFGDRRVAMHANAALGALVVKRYVGQHRLTHCAQSAIGNDVSLSESSGRDRGIELHITRLYVKFDARLDQPRWCDAPPCTECATACPPSTCPAPPWKTPCPPANS